jgi:type III pantothenate kinase
VLLALDVGNTNVTLGVFAGDSLRATWRLATDESRLADEYGVLMLSLLQHEDLSPDDISEAVMSCVVPDLEAVFERVCERYFGCRPLAVGTGIRTGLSVLYDSARDVGADRVADAVAAIHAYGPPLIIVDLGTAIVFDAVDKDGAYLGGAIAPGLGIATEALFRRAAKLQPVDLSRPEFTIGRNTVASVQSGILFGYVGLVEGIVARMKKELGEGVTVICTGGYAELIASETDMIDAVNLDLTLEGLRIIFDLNRA